MSEKCNALVTTALVCGYRLSMAAVSLTIARIRYTDMLISPPTALLYKPIDRVTRSTLVLHVSTKTNTFWFSISISIKLWILVKQSCILMLYSFIHVKKQTQ